ncbi:hypothetical protein [uncultured Corynebacterium sp.]|uniref:hypothetical protein n=1 Tax=uncultured Corynebacterium sp. TaxID=159447 RepID=UPI0025E90B21|nr:hypothetical protein [uncultured Corynebacterium sp.]
MANDEKLDRQRNGQPNGKSAGKSSAASVIGMATAVGLVLGLGAWLVTTYVMDGSNSEALRAAASAFGLAIFAGAVIALVREFGQGR